MMRPGTRLAERFELRMLAGAGGMGQVFRAMDTLTGEEVAVKVLQQLSSADLQRFTREARVLASLDHPGIVRYIAQGTADRPFLVMEWLDGDDLAAFLRKRTRLTVDEALVLVRRMAQALAHAHARGICHRDLKPGNIFLPHEHLESAKLLDFGVAHFDARTCLTRPGLLVGTPGYMAPEQARAGEGIGPAADIFSLGCVFFEILTGQPAFQGDTLLALLAKLVFDEPPRLRHVRPDLPSTLEGLLGRMLAKDPARRITDGAALLDALDELRLDDDGETLPSAPVPGVLGHHERRSMSLVLIGSGSVGSAPAVGDASTEVAIEDLATLATFAESAGARVERLADGSLALAIFGGGVAKDQAVVAARIALAVRARMSDRPVALATGIGDSSDRLLLGAVFERAARLLKHASAATHGGALLDDVTAALLDPHFERTQGPDGPELLAEHEQLDSGRTLLGRATPCVGRDRELRMLAEAFASCSEEQEPTVIMITGPAGAGKSRLAHEFLKAARHHRPELAVWTCRGDVLHTGSALGLVVQLLRGVFDLFGDGPEESRQRAFADAVGRIVPAADRARVTAFLGELVGVPGGLVANLALEAARRDPQLMAEQTRQAFADLIRHAAVQAPLILLIEDLQWGDTASLRFIDAALRAASDSPLLVLVLARPEAHERFPRSWQEFGRQEFNLRPLTSRASAQLIHAVLGDAVAPEVVRSIVERAEGDAFFLEELIRATAAGQVELPETVVATVRLRLETLNPELRRVLRAASVFGEACWNGGVAALIDRDVAQIRGDLQRLVEAELLVRRPQSRFSGCEEFMFRHALHREGAYAMLTPDDRVLGHALAAQWLESTGEAEPGALAEHFERAGRGDLAGRYYLAAAELAHRSSDSDAALRLSRQGLDSPDVPQDIRADLLGLVADIHGWRYQPDIGVPYAVEAMRIAPAGSVTWIRATNARILAEIQRGDVATMIELVDDVVRVPASPMTAGLLSLPLVLGIVSLDGAGRIADAERILAHLRALEAILPADERLVRAWTSALCGSRAAAIHDDPGGGLRECLRAAPIFAAAEHRRGTFNTNTIIGMNLWHLGDLESAIECLREIAPVHREIGVLAAYPLFCLALACCDRGDLVEGEAWARELVRSGQERGVLVDEGRGRWALAHVHLCAGDFERAVAEVSAARRQLAVMPLEIPGVLAVAAASALAGGEHQEALALAEEAYRRCETLGACGFFFGGHVRLVRAESLRAAGQHDAARTALAAARDRIDAIVAGLPDPRHRETLCTRRPELARTLALARAFA